MYYYVYNKYTEIKIFLSNFLKYYCLFLWVYASKHTIFNVIYIVELYTHLLKYKSSNHLHQQFRNITWFKI